MILDLKGVTRHYGTRRGVEGINLSLEEGEIVGLLGPNGCGKTTLIKLIMGILQKDGGTIRIEGLEPAKAHHLISYLPDTSYLDPWMNMNQAFQIFKDFYRDFNEEKARGMLRDFGLEADLPLKNMSKGMQEKAQLTLVMGREASFYILDEPLSGIDPAARETIRDGILDHYHPGSSLLITTHLVSDVESLFDRVIFMDQGQIVLDRNVEDIRMQEGKSVDALFREMYAPKQGGRYA